MVRAQVSGNPVSCRRRAGGRSGGFSQSMESLDTFVQESLSNLCSASGIKSLPGFPRPCFSNQCWFLMQTAEESSFLCLGTMCDNPGSVN